MLPITAAGYTPKVVALRVHNWATGFDKRRENSSLYANE